MGWPRHLPPYGLKGLGLLIDDGRLWALAQTVGPLRSRSIVELCPNGVGRRT
jgi:hypothetical protein